MTGRAGLDPGHTVVRVLGEFSATAGGRALPLGGYRQRAVLARVLAGEGEAVSAEQIADDVWGEQSADATVASVHAYVSRLRRLLGHDALPRRPSGYVLDRSVVPVDADLFVADVDVGRRALRRGDDRAAADVLAAALARWSAPSAFGGNLRDAHFLAPLVARLEELRVVAAEALADAHARRGNAADDIALLEELAARDPLRESVTVRLVGALHAADRQADALAAFDRCSRALADELGVLPTPALRRVHAAVLAQQPISGVAGCSPTRLPPRNRCFVGRGELLRAVEGALDDETHRPRAVALTGLAGVGKTELATELAHRRHRRGRVAWWLSADDPAALATGLAELATALGIAAFERGEDTRAALWTELDRTPGWLLVYDNADEPRLMESFLPAARHGDVIVTSRNPAWRRLARPVAVGPLTREESVTYVAMRVGDRPAEAGTLADLLGDLPLALEQACAYLEQTGMSVPDYVRLFRRRREGLLRRDADGSGRTVATTWGLAFDRLAERSPRATALLETIAFLAPDAIGVETLRRLEPDELELHDALGELLRLSLVDREGDDVRVHRLVQDVVRARMKPDARVRRLDETVRACLTQVGEPGRITDALTMHLVGLAGHADALDTVPNGLIEALSTVANRQADRALYPAAEHLLRAALRLHGPAGGPAMRGRLTCELGRVLDAAGRLEEALELHRQAVRMLEGGVDDGRVEADDLVLAYAHNRLGHVLNCADDAPAAVEAQRRALAVLHRAGRDDLLPAVLIDLGYTFWGAGRLDAAKDALSSGRQLLERQGRRGERDWAHATAGLGMVEQDAGHLDEAVTHQRVAISAFSHVVGPDHPDTAQALDKLGYVLRLQGRMGESVDAHRRSVRLLERVLGPDDSRVAMSLTNLGLALRDAGDPDQAVTVQTRARSIFLSALGPTHSSTLMAGWRLADALADAGQPARARAVRDEVVSVAGPHAANGADLALGGPLGVAPSP